MTTMNMKLQQFWVTYSKSFTLYLLIGLCNTSLYIGLFAILWYLMHFNHVIAVSIAFFLASMFQFFANRKYTFKVADKSYGTQLVKYLLLLLINYSLSVICVELAVLLLLSPLVGVIIAVIINPLVGYLLFNFWIFPKKIAITGVLKE